MFVEILKLRFPAYKTKLESSSLQITKSIYSDKMLFALNEKPCKFFDILGVALSWLVIFCVEPLIMA